MRVHANELRPGWVLLGDEGNRSIIYSIDRDTDEARLLNATFLSTEHGITIIYNENPEVEIV